MSSPAHPTSEAWTGRIPQVDLQDSIDVTHIHSPADTRRAVWKWWQWPHLLSLDAPLVAVTWQWWWSETRKVSVSWDQRVILGMAVWMMYLADRLADACRGREDEICTDRHRFYALHRTLAKWLLAGAGLSLAVSTPFLLPAGQFSGGLVLLALAVLYFWMIHRARRPVKPWLPKEAVVGGMFSVGTAYFVVCNAGYLSVPLLLGGALFGALCFLNCALITRWEQSPQDLNDPDSLLRAFPRLAGALPELTLGLAVLAAAVAWMTKDIGRCPVALGAAALWTLDRCRRQLSTRALRVLADFVLLTPLLVGCWVAVLRRVGWLAL